MISSEPSLDKDCVVFKVSDSNTVQDMALEWRTYDCTQAKDAIPICQFSTSSFDIKIDEPQGTFFLIFSLKVSYFGSKPLISKKDAIIILSMF